MAAGEDRVEVLRDGVRTAVLESGLSVDADTSDGGMPDAESSVQLRRRDACESVGDEPVHAVLQGAAPFSVRSERLRALPQTDRRGGCA